MPYSNLIFYMATYTAYRPHPTLYWVFPTHTIDLPTYVAIWQ